MCGKRVVRETKFDSGLTAKLFESRGEIPGVIANTLCSDDYYESQGRMDGAICEHTDKDREAFLQKAFDVCAHIHNLKALIDLFQVLF